MLTNNKIYHPRITSVWEKLKNFTDRVDVTTTIEISLTFRVQTEPQATTKNVVKSDDGSIILVLDFLTSE